MDFEHVPINGFVILLLVLYTFLAISLIIYLGNRFPRKRWLGILLSIIFSPWGQAYIEGSSRYIVALIILTFLSKASLDNYYLLPLICSPIMMWFRFNKYKKSEAEQIKEQISVPDTKIDENQ